MKHLLKTAALAAPLLDKPITIPDLQRLYEIILGVKFDRRLRAQTQTPPRPHCLPLPAQ